MILYKYIAIGPKFFLYKPILITSIFDDDSTKNECASTEIPFSDYKSMGIFLRCSREANSKVSGPIQPKFKLVRDFMNVLVTWRLKRIRSKATEKRWQPDTSISGVNLTVKNFPVCRLHLGWMLGWK